MKYVYPALFTPLSGGRFDVYIPDLPHCRTYGTNLADAIEMAEDAASMWLWDAENNSEAIPSASSKLPHDPPQFVSMIVADTDAYRRREDSRAVKKTLSIPAWLNHRAEAANVNFSGILQDALKEHLGMAK